MTLGSSVRRCGALCVSLLAAALWLGCGSGHDGPVSLVLSMSVPEEHPLRRTAAFVEEDLARRSGGRIRLYLDVVGDGKALPDVALRNPLRMRMASFGYFGGYFPPLGAFEAPYMLDDAEHMFRVARSPWGRRLITEAERLSEHRILGVWYEGMRHVTLRDTPATTPEEFGDVKLRVPASAQHVETARVLGAQPTTMGLRNVYTGLRIGTIDGQENPLPTVRSMRFHEVCDYLVLTHHRVSAVLPTMADSIWQRISAEDREVIVASFQEGGRVNRKIVERSEQELLAEFSERWMEVLEPDLDPFRRRARHAWRRYRDVWGDSMRVMIGSMAADSVARRR